MTTTEAPSPTVAPGFVAASASEFTEKDPLVPIVTSPVATSVSGSEPIEAVVWSLVIAMAIPAPMPTSPAAPFWPQVRTVWVELAVTVTSPALVRAAPSCTSASVVSVTMLRASEAPTPRLVPVAAPAGSAQCCDGRVVQSGYRDIATAWRQPKRPVSIRASLVLLTILIATAPATPMSPAPAPETARARKTFIGLGSSIPALTLTPSALIVEAPIVASAEALTRFTATAAPTPTFAVPASVPQAFAVSPLTTLAGSPVSLLALTVKGPAAVMVRPPGIVASAELRDDVDGHRGGHGD